MPEKVELLLLSGVDVADIDMCAYGMTTVKYGQEGPAMKPTKIASNSPEVLKRLNERCPNRAVPGTHCHIKLDEGRARQAQVYPRRFCEKVVEGIAAQKRLVNLGLKSVPLLSLQDMEDVARSVGEYSGEDGLHPSDALHDPDHDSGNLQAYDDQTGVELDPILMRQARRDEIAYFKDMKVYTKVSIE